MALSTTDRQRAYREKIRRGELKRFQFALPLETGIKVDYLCEALHCNKAELFSRLILEEWKRQGEPLRGWLRNISEVVHEDRLAAGSRYEIFEGLIHQSYVTIVAFKQYYCGTHNECFGKYMKGISINGKKLHEIMMPLVPYENSNSVASQRYPSINNERANKVNTMAVKITERQSQHLSFISQYMKVNGRSPVESDMQRYFGVSPPTVHQIVFSLWLTISTSNSSGSNLPPNHYNISSCSGWAGSWIASSKSP